MITIEYKSDGDPISDGKAEEFVRRLVKIDKGLIPSGANFGKNPQVTVGTENVIFAARVLKKEENINVQFKFKDQILVPDKNGRLAEWPDGFGDSFDKWLMRLLYNE